MYKLLKQAFTLIELLVVIAIIGILSGLIIVGMSGMTQKATIAKAQVFSSSLRNSLLGNIIGEWKLDEGGGTAANDTWTKTNNGTLYNFANTTAGYGDTNSDGWMSSSNCISGPCLKFDGVDDYVDLGNMSSIENIDKMTVSFWFKAITISPLRSLVSKATGGQLSSISFTVETGLGLGNSILVGIPSATDSYAFTAAGIITANNWYNITCVFDGSQSGNTNRLKVYMNGQQQNLGFNDTIPALIPISGTNLNFGRFADGTRYFNGSIDDVRIYNATMPTSQIKEEYYAGLNKLLANGSISKKEYIGRINKAANSISTAK